MKIEQIVITAVSNGFTIIHIGDTQSRMQSFIAVTPSDVLENVALALEASDADRQVSNSILRGFTRGPGEGPVGAPTGNA